MLQEELVHTDFDSSLVLCLAIFIWKCFEEKWFFFLYLYFFAKCCFNICCEKNQINPSSCWFDVPPLRLHLSIIPNFNINCADSGLSRTLWTVVLFFGVQLSFPFKKGLLRKYFIHMEQSFLKSKVYSLDCINPSTFCDIRMRFVHLKCSWDLEPLCK